MPKPYFCKNCNKKHYRGKIYEDHIKFKEEKIRIKDSDNFSMKGKLGEDLEVRTNRMSDHIIISIYKDEALACYTRVNPQEEELIKRNQVRSYIKNNCL
ncbi:MAG: hypothetical protein GF317_14010 [Candidatus Lokiarchaeota archaeon]|nr:hypothetical protein [Candidatus Lokiarchaeota archaeon]MBD3200731.1 hypothetical protein [Candidatus Lokiarchaeota archaeon]